MKNRILILAIFATSAFSCSEINLFEKNVQVPDHQWAYDFKPEISFDITDTTSFYQIFFVFRHTDAFGYNNIWVKVESSAPGNSTGKTEQFDFPLTSNNKWTGSGMDDIYEHRILLYNGPVKFRHSGTYKVRLEQVMRESPLKHVLNVGLRVEKVKT